LTELAEQWRQHSLALEKDLAKALRERDEAQAMLSDAADRFILACRERDKALAKVAELTHALTIAGEWVPRRERDEAWEVAETLHGHLTWALQYLEDLNLFDSVRWSKADLEKAHPRLLGE
jgi:hypothetical protein